MAVTIEIRDRQKRVPLNPHRIRRIIRQVLKAEGVPQAELSVAFVTDRQIQVLNKQFLRKDRPTDVLAFDLRSGGPASSGAGRTMEGEIVISTGAAARNAREFVTSSYRETVLYLVHGLLHLSGYDDHVPEDTARMRARESEIMGMLDRSRLSRPES